MREREDLSRGLLRKAASDIVALDALLGAGALDAACFHAQQAAEKCLKAFLAYHQVAFPYSHNLTKLVELCVEIDPTFAPLAPDVAPLTPYAVELRYDDSFWPPLDTASEARASALKVRDFVLERLPEDILRTSE
jgi:HEPN domain-containing protein